MKKVTSIMMITALFLMAGCAGLNPGASRSQTQTYNDCEFKVVLPSAATGYGDLFAQAMMIEHSGGNESDTATQTQTTDVPVDVSIPTGTDAITALVGAGAKGITSGLTDDGETTEAEAAEVVVDPDCPDGNCFPD